MSHKGVLSVVSGFSGAGKGTVMKSLMSKYNNYALSISATTRKPREGEENGREYFFKTVEEFKEMINNNQLIEYATYNGNFYGTPKAYVESKLNEGFDVVLEIEPQGAMQIKEQNDDVVLIFITPPSADELKRRLVNRGTEDMDTINARLAIAEKESVYMDKYDYLLVNDELEVCVEELHNTIKSEHLRVNRNINKINSIKEDLKVFSEKR